MTVTEQQLAEQLKRLEEGVLVLVEQGRRGHITQTSLELLASLVTEGRERRGHVRSR